MKIDSSYSVINYHSSTSKDIDIQYDKKKFENLCRHRNQTLKVFHHIVQGI